MPPLKGVWYWAFLREIFSKKNKAKMNRSKKNDNWLANTKSSNETQELYIPVVRVDIPKKETAPKSDSVSMATKASPATIAGLADGKIIEKKDFIN